MKARDYIKMRTEIQAECKHKLESLDTVWRLFHPNDELPTERMIEPAGAVSATRDWPFSISKRLAVRQAVAGLQGDFSAKDVRVALTALHEGWSEKIDENQLSSLVARLASRGELETVQAKSGRSAATYRRKADDDAIVDSEIEDGEEE